MSGIWGNKNLIDKIVDTEDKKRLLSNFFSLSFLQGVNLILPLLTIPYLVRVLGVEYFGLLAFATAVIAYFGIITDYGFNLTATREVSIHRDNKENLIEIFSSVMTIKFILMFISLIMLSVLVISFNKFHQNALIYFLTFGAVIGQVLFPIWFFQGMERMKYITYLNILSKVIFTVAIFIFVKEQNDFWIVPLLNSFGFIIVGMWSLYLIKKDFDIRFKIPFKSQIVYYLKDGYHVFIASLFGNLYNQGNIIILGLFTTPLIVGYYSVAVKLAGAIVSLFQVLTQTIFPYLAKMKNYSYNKFKATSLKFLQNTVIIDFLLIGSVFLFSDQLYTLISGKSDPIGYYSFSFWLIVAFITIINVVLNPVIISLRQDKFMSKIYLFVGISFIFYGTVLTHYFSYKGMLFSMLIVELSILTLSIIAIKKGFKEYSK